MKEKHETFTDMIGNSMSRAYAQGQLYWQQADSESYTHNRKSADTSARFAALRAEVVAASAALLAERDALLEALQDLKREITLSDVDPQYVESHFRPWLNKARVAIAVAEGNRLEEMAARAALGEKP